MAQRFCPRCGTQLMDNATFCHVCGMTCGTTNMPIPQNYSPQGAHQAPPAQPAYYIKPKVPGRGFGISSMVLGIVGAFYCFVLMIGMSALSDVMNISNEILGEEFYYSSSALDSTIYTSMFTAVIMYAIMPLLALIFGFNARKRGYQNGISTSGLILGSLGLVFSLISIIAILDQL